MIKCALYLDMPSDDRTMSFKGIAILGLKVELFPGVSQVVKKATHTCLRNRYKNIFKSYSSV